MAYINLDINYFDHIKTKRLVSRLGKHAEILPVKLWCYASKHPMLRGRLMTYTPRDVAGVLAWRGDPVKLINVLVELKFLDRIGENDYQIHEWEEYQGHLIAFSERGKVAAKKRWEKYKENKNDGRYRELT